MTLRGLPSDSTCILKAEPGKLDIKGRQPGIFFYQFSHCFIFKASDYNMIFEFCVGVIQKV